MFWKLLKYEFKNINKWYLGLYGAILAVSLGIGLFMVGVARNLGIISQHTGEQLTSAQSASLGFSVILYMIFFGLLVALSISTLFLIIRRFKNSIYERQGYLTLTLPVNQHQIILSKLSGALIWSFLSSITLLLSILIIGGLIASAANQTWIFNWDSSNVPNIVYLLQFLFYLLVSTSAQILLIYLAISIGQLFEDHRTALAILAYFAIQILISLLSVQLSSGAMDYSFDLVFPIIFNLALSIAYYTGTYFILKNKVNLQ